MSRITTEIKYSLVLFRRNRQSIFFAFALPVIFLILAWYLSGGASGPVTIYYVDGDDSPTSAALIEALNSTPGLNLANGAGTDLPELLKSRQIEAYLEIPRGFGARSEGSAASCNVSDAELKIFYDGSRPYTASAVAAVRQAVAGFNANRTGAKALAGLETQAVSAGGAGYADSLLPGILGIAIFGTAFDMTIGFVAINRANGILRKLGTTPLSAIEWLVSRMIAGTIAALLSVAMALFLAYAFFGARSGISFTTVPLVIAGSVMAVGLGVVLACLVRDVQSAVSASFTVTLPLILVSGSLFPVSRLPWFLSAISAISPLTYLNDGLRGAMVPGSTAGAITDLAVVGLIGIILAGASLVIMRRGVR